MIASKSAVNKKNSVWPIPRAIISVTLSCLTRIVWFWFMGKLALIVPVPHGAIQWGSSCLRWNSMIWYHLESHHCLYHSEIPRLMLSDHVIYASFVDGPGQIRTPCLRSVAADLCRRCVSDNSPACEITRRYTETIVAQPFHEMEQGFLVRQILIFAACRNQWLHGIDGLWVWHRKR